MFIVTTDASHCSRLKRVGRFALLHIRPGGITRCWHFQKITIFYWTCTARRTVTSWRCVAAPYRRVVWRRPCLALSRADARAARGIPAWLSRGRTGPACAGVRSPGHHAFVCHQGANNGLMSFFERAFWLMTHLFAFCRNIKELHILETISSSHASSGPIQLCGQQTYFACFLFNQINRKRQFKGSEDALNCADA